MKHFQPQRIFAMLAMAVGLVGTLGAQGYVSTDRFGYSGTVSRYATQADALGGMNAVSGSPFAIGARDLGLYMVDGNLGFGGATYANSAMFLSAWYLNGGNTPSNQNNGFIQLYDIDGGSVSSMNAAWTDPTMTSFAFSVTGGSGVPGCVSPGDCGRLWNAGSAPGGASVTTGVYWAYSLSFVATGLAPAVWNPATGVYESNSNPTNATGSLWALFENTSTSDPGSNGWYVLNLDIDMNSLYGQESESYFGASDVVPEPATMTLLATGLAGMAAARRRRAAR